MIINFRRVQYSLIAVTCMIVLLSLITNNVHSGSYSWLAVAVLLLINGIISINRKRRVDGLLYLTTAVFFIFLFIKF